MRHPLFLSALVIALPCATLRAQRVVATANVNVRSGHSTASPIIGRLGIGDTVALLDTTRQRGYYHVEESDQTKGWVYSRYVRLVLDTTGAAIATSHATDATPGTPGTSSLAGCGDGLWQHVYHPHRLLVKQQCVTVRGTIVDATHGRQHDGARHEADGDTHSWIRLDPEFRDMLDAGNMSDEDGNLVFEIVCHYTVTQTDAEPACNGFSDHTVIPPIGAHVEITGSYVQDTNHAHWNELHPVSKIVVKP